VKVCVFCGTYQQERELLAGNKCYFCGVAPVREVDEGTKSNKRYDALLEMANNAYDKWVRESHCYDPEEAFVEGYKAAVAYLEGRDTDEQS
jgi:hypothetical protein